MISQKNKRDIFQIIPFGVIWFGYALIYMLIEKGLLHDLEYYPSTGNEYNFGSITLIYLAIATFTGLLLGNI